MFLIRTALLLSISMLLSLPVRAETMNNNANAIKTSWDPQHTWVFSVGVLQWKEKSLETFTTRYRRDAAIVESFEKSGVPRDHIVYMQDKQATLKSIRAQLANMLAQTQLGDTLFFYYCGHGWITKGVGYYGNYDASDDEASSCWSTRSISSDLKAFKGSTLIFTVDCCESGSIIKALEQAHLNFNWGVLTAAVAGESSTGNWTFSQSLLDCLSGHRYADANNDGAVTFAELGSYITDEMKFFEHQDAAVAYSSGFDPAYKLGSVTLAGEQIPRRAEAEWKGKWWPCKLLQTKGDQGKIHWITIGWDAPADDEWIALTRIRKIQGTPDYTRATASDASSSLEVGSEIKVKYKGKWYPAKIVKIQNGKYFIHYDNYDNSWDEWVATDRIK